MSKSAKMVTVKTLNLGKEAGRGFQRFLGTHLLLTVRKLRVLRVDASPKETREVMKLLKYSTPPGWGGGVKRWKKQNQNLPAYKTTYWDKDL